MSATRGEEQDEERGTGKGSRTKTARGSGLLHPGAHPSRPLVEVLGEPRELLGCDPQRLR
jgi:hypothetical protein